MKMKRNRNETIENRSFETTTRQELTVINESVKWVGETRPVHFLAHGPLFDRSFSIDDLDQLSIKDLRVHMI